MRTIGYQAYLHYWSIRMIDRAATSEHQKTILEQAQKSLQKTSPGNYQVEEFYNSKKHRLDLRLKFHDPKEELFWLLRWA
jgi:hypothetical protein